MADFDFDEDFPTKLSNFIKEHLSKSFPQQISININFKQLSEADAGKAFQRALTHAMIDAGVVPNQSVEYDYKNSIFSVKIQIDNKITLPDIKIPVIPKQLHYYSEKSQFKQAVELLADAASRLIQQCYLPSSLKVRQADIHQIHEVLTRDYPNLWFIYGIQCRAREYVYQVVFSFNKLTEQQILDYDNKIQLSIKKIVESCQKFKSDMQKQYCIQSFFSSKITYCLQSKDPFQNDNIRNLIGVFVTQQCVCAGMAYAFKTLCDYLQIPAIVVYGYGGKTENAQEAHAWNMCCIENEWYFFDPTWNHDEHPYGEWFNVTRERIEMDHIEDDADLIPQATSFKMNLFELQRERIAERDDKMPAEEQLIKIIQNKLLEKRLKIGILQDQIIKIDLQNKFFFFFNKAKYQSNVNCQADNVKFKGETVFFDVKYSDEKLIFEFPNKENAVKNVKYFVQMEPETAAKQISAMGFGCSMEGDEGFAEFVLM